MRHSKALVVSICASLVTTAPALASGYGGSKPTGFAASSANIVAKGGTDTLRVVHKQSAFAGAEIKKKSDGAYGGGNSATYTKTAPGVTAVSVKRSVEQGTAYSDGQTAVGTGYSATLLKVQASDGSYFLYKGSAGAAAGVTPGGNFQGSGSSYASKSGKF